VEEDEEFEESKKEERHLFGRKRARKARGRRAKRAPDLSFIEEGPGLEEEGPEFRDMELAFEETGAAHEKEAFPGQGPAAAGPVEEVLAPTARSEEEEVTPAAKPRPRPEKRELARRREPRGPGAGGARVIVPLIIAAAVATLVISILYTRFSAVDFGHFFFYLLVFTLCAGFDFRIKGGGSLNMGLAPLLAALISLPGVQVVWIFLIGSIIAMFIRSLGKATADDVFGLLIDYAGVGAAAVIFHFFMDVIPEKPLLHGNYWPGVLASITIAAGVLFLVYLVRSTFILSQEGYLPVTVYFKSMARRSWLAFLALGFIGVLMGLIYRGIGMWSVLFALPLLLVSAYAYNRVAETDRYLLDTIRILSVIPEETGRVATGHAERVAELSVGVARELGLSPEDVQQTEYAAYLHDIGAITKEKPDDEQQQLLETEGVIEGGVDIVGRVGYLEVAAEILRGREGLKDRVEDVNKRRAISMGAGILRAVDDFELLVQGSEGRDPLSEGDALTEMNLERGVRYDSKVLRAIAKVLPRLQREGASSIVEGSAEGSPVRGEPEG